MRMAESTNATDVMPKIATPRTTSHARLRRSRRAARRASDSRTSRRGPNTIVAANTAPTAQANPNSAADAYVPNGRTVVGPM